MRKLTAALAALFAVNSFAYVTSFTFDVESDIGEMWVCGAEVEEREGPTPFELFNGGNYMKAVSNGEDVTVSATADANPGRIGPVEGNYSWSKGWNRTELSDLTFFLGSERFGATYRVRICWQGPDFNLDEVADNAGFETNYGAFLFSAVVSDEDGYVADSNLKSSARWRCSRYDGSYNSWIPNIADLGEYSDEDASSPNFTAGVLALENTVLNKCTATFEFNEDTFATRVEDQSASINVTAGLFRRD